MARFGTTTRISSCLEDIIKEARERLTLISPYIKINPLIRPLLEEKVSQDVVFQIVCREKDLTVKERDWLKSMSSLGVCVRFCENLHAKCYLNERSALITSMNLYEYAQNNNIEMGLLVSKEEDPDAYKLVIKEVDRILNYQSGPMVVQESTSPLTEAPTSGFCIRCKSNLSPNPLKPYCRGCYRNWNGDKNEDYEEKYCHFCGKEHGSTMRKPACLNCYRQYKDVLEFAAV